MNPENQVNRKRPGVFDDSERLSSKQRRLHNSRPLVIFSDSSVPKTVQSNDTPVPPKDAGFVDWYANSPLSKLGDAPLSDLTETSQRSYLSADDHEIPELRFKKYPTGLKRDSPVECELTSTRPFWRNLINVSEEPDHAESSEEESELIRKHWVSNKLKLLKKPRSTQFQSFTYKLPKEENTEEKKVEEKKVEEVVRLNVPAFDPKTYISSIIRENNENNKQRQQRRLAKKQATLNRYKKRRKNFRDSGIQPSASFFFNPSDDEVDNEVSEVSSDEEIDWETIPLYGLNELEKKFIRTDLSITELQKSHMRLLGEMPGFQIIKRLEKFARMGNMVLSFHITEAIKYAYERFILVDLIPKGPRKFAPFVRINGEKVSTLKMFDKHRVQEPGIIPLQTERTLYLRPPKKSTDGKDSSEDAEAVDYVKAQLLNEYDEFSRKERDRRYDIRERWIHYHKAWENEVSEGIAKG